MVTPPSLVHPGFSIALQVWNWNGDDKVDEVFAQGNDGNNSFSDEFLSLSNNGYTALSNAHSPGLQVYNTTVGMRGLDYTLKNRRGWFKREPVVQYAEVGPLGK